MLSALEHDNVFCGLKPKNVGLMGSNKVVTSMMVTYSVFFSSKLALEEDAILAVVFDDLPLKDLLGRPLEDLLGRPRLASGISSSEESSKEANILVFFSWLCLESGMSSSDSSSESSELAFLSASSGGGTTCWISDCNGDDTELLVGGANGGILERKLSKHRNKTWQRNDSYLC